VGGEPIGSGTLYDQVRVTLSEMVTGYLIGGVLGISMGFYLGRTRGMARVLEPFIFAFYGIPIIAIAPIFLLLFGIGPPSKVAISTMTTFFVVFFQTYSGVASLNEEMAFAERQLLRWQPARQRIAGRASIRA
jgi:NitT/TauT family transport system permease protein